MKKHILGVIALVVYSCNLPAQEPASSLQQNVNTFTGDFSYSVPVVDIPNPGGAPVKLSANYNAGIGMRQSASWVGLGWSLNPGEITRNLNGYPDDWNGATVTMDQIQALCGNLSTISVRNTVKRLSGLRFNCFSLR